MQNEPTFTRTINDIRFAVDPDGYVRVDGDMELGHIEDCERFAAMVFDLFELNTNPDSDSRSAPE